MCWERLLKNVARSLLEILNANLCNDKQKTLLLNVQSEWKLSKLRDEKEVFSGHIDVINWDTDTEMKTKDIKFSIYMTRFLFRSSDRKKLFIAMDGNFYAYFTCETFQTLILVKVVGGGGWLGLKKGSTRISHLWRLPDDFHSMLTHICVGGWISHQKENIDEAWSSITTLDLLLADVSFETGKKCNWKHICWGKELFNALSCKSFPRRCLIWMRKFVGKRVESRD